MRHDLIESLSVGVSIGVVVLAIRALPMFAPTWEPVAVLLAGLALIGLQLWLALRRRGRREGYHGPEARPPRGPAMPSRDNPFIRELTPTWMGLDERVSGTGSPPAAGERDEGAPPRSDSPG